VLPAVPPLRVLVVLAASPNPEAADPQGEMGIMQAAPQKPLREGRARVLLDGPTLPEIGESVRTFRPHVLHYVGRGVHDKRGGWSFLVLEPEWGQTERVHGGDLQKILQPGRALQVVVLSGCHTASLGEFSAFADVALELLQVGIPTVLKKQARLPADPGQAVRETFYDALAHSHTVAGALHRARVSLREGNGPASADRAVPALYVRDSGLRVIDPKLASRSVTGRASALDVLGLPLPADFVGRKAELQQLRDGLRDRDIRAIYVRAYGGMGRSSLIAKLLQAGPLDGDGVLVVRCQEGDPLHMPIRLARFLAEQAKAPGLTGHAEPAFPLADPALAGLFEGLLGASWRSLCQFTARQRWSGLQASLRAGAAREILPGPLAPRQSVSLMDSLPHLRRESLESKMALHSKLGGHPSTIVLADGFLVSHPVDELLDDAALDDLPFREREDTFVSRVLMEITQTLYATQRHDWRNWLQEHYRSEKEIWLVFTRKGSGKPRLAYNDAVEEALCFGWIDSTVKRLDEEHFAQRFSPRRAKSGYSQTNKERLRKLISQGKLMPDVLARLGDVDLEAFEFAADIMAALRENPRAWENFQTYSESYQRIRVAYIDGARDRSGEYEKRLRHFIRMTEQDKQFGYGIEDLY